MSMIKKNALKCGGMLSVLALATSMLPAAAEAGNSQLAQTNGYSSSPYSGSSDYSTDTGSDGYSTGADDSYSSGTGDSYSAPPAATRVLVPSGTVVVVRSEQMISSDNVTAGTTLNFTVARDVKIYDERAMTDRIVIKAGASARVIANDAEASGSLGEGGRLSLMVQTVDAVDGSELDVTGSTYLAGDDSTGSTVALSMLLCPLFLLMEGDAAELPAGFEIRSRTAGTQTVDLR